MPSFKFTLIYLLTRALQNYFGPFEKNTLNASEYDANRQAVLNRLQKKHNLLHHNAYLSKKCRSANKNEIKNKEILIPQKIIKKRTIKF